MTCLLGNVEPLMESSSVGLHLVLPEEVRHHPGVVTWGDGSPVEAVDVVHGYPFVDGACLRSGLRLLMGYDDHLQVVVEVISCFQPAATSGMRRVRHDQWAFLHGDIFILQ